MKFPLSQHKSPTPQVVGYHVFAALSPDGPFKRLTGAPVTVSAPTGAPLTTFTFTDNTSTQVREPTYYAVVAVGKITSGSVTYFDSSQGVLSPLVTPIRPSPPQRIYTR